MRFSGPAGRRDITLEARDSQGTLLWTHALKAAELRFPRARQDEP
jgi:hypothetical protein